jgi:heme/copper-type cytochrome/quinol oxidase subunit 2
MTGNFNTIVRWLLLTGCGLAPQVLLADKPVFELEIRNHLFSPAEITIPANTKIRLQVTNSDPTPEEFESYELNREKVIPGNRSAVIFIGPLAPGTYPFFGEFYPKTAQGRVIAK